MRRALAVNIAVIASCVTLTAPAAQTSSARTEIAFVANAEAGTVALVDVESRSIVGVLDINPARAERKGPGATNYAQDTDVSPDGRTIYVSRGYLGDVAAFDLSSGKLLWQRPLNTGRADHMTITRDGRSLFVSALMDNRVYKISTATGEINGHVVTGVYPHDVKVSKDGQRLYNSSLGPLGSLPRAAGATPLAEKPGVTSADWDFEAPHHGLALTEDGATLCLAARASDYAALVNARDLTLIATIPVGDAPGWAEVAQEGRVCLIANTRSDDLSIISIPERAEVARLAIGNGPKHITIARIPNAVIAAFGSSTVGALVVHEWGTFTSFQDSQGLTISGINVDDEPVPKFVHRLRDVPIFTTHSAPASWSQGAPRCHSDVTLRLETPVLYFYPENGFPLDRSFDVRATFAGGWLTEFFPLAAADNSGFPRTLEHSTRGSIRWQGLQLSRDSEIRLPETTERVWLAPRNVKSAVVINGDKAEAEKYLFYRGVGHLDAPIVVRKEAASLTLSLRDDERLLDALPRMWVVHVSADGRVAYRSVQASKQRSVTTALPIASDTAFSELAALRRELKSALTAEGLYQDEADAMLETWQLSYFDSEGMRVFLVLPRAWTDAQLPLSMSVPATISRVMLGRVELISPHQQAVLRTLYELPAKAFDVPPLYYENQSVLERVRTGNESHAELYRSVGREVPDALRLYESLGRFRDALLMHESRVTSDPDRRARLNMVIARFSSCAPELFSH